MEPSEDVSLMAIEIISLFLIMCFVNRSFIRFDVFTTDCIEFHAHRKIKILFHIFTYRNNKHISMCVSPPMSYSKTQQNNYILKQLNVA